METPNFDCKCKREGMDLHMPPASAEKKTLQAAITECGCQREKLRNFAEEIVAGLSGIPAPGGERPLDIFIAELVLSAADQRRRAERKQRQRECIIAAKEKGVRFGAQAAPLPANFDARHQAWRSGELSFRQAAESCGVGKTTFRDAVLRKEKEAAAAS